MKRSAKQVRATNRNWAIFDIRGTRSRIMRIASQQLVPAELTTLLLKDLTRLEKAIIKVKP